MNLFFTIKALEEIVLLILLIGSILFYIILFLVSAISAWLDERKNNDE